MKKKTLISTNKKIIAAFIIIAAVITGCSTEKNTLLSRNYHNITARYNVYFNGKEAFNNGVRTIDENFVDNYAEILPVFNYGNKTVNEMCASDMDVAITKSIKLLTKHSITSRPPRRGNTNSARKKAFYKQEEFCKWVDDGYFLMGKAQFYKHEFELAQETFLYLAQSYEEQPIKYVALLWRAKAFAEAGEYKDAKDQLDVLEGDDEFPAELYKDLSLIYADLYLKQDLLNQAQPRLDTVIKIIDNSRFNFREKKLNTRYKYIMAQIFMAQKNYSDAADMFTKVIKENPEYIMTFNAKISRAQSFDVAGGNSDQIKAELEKLLKDEKNYDLKDQIYFALAEIAMKENKEEEAIEYYRKSILYSITNSNQKALAYLALANIFFEAPDYIQAQAYYDSTVVLLYDSYPGYNEIVKRSENLNQLVENLNIINTEDSLQRWAALSDVERNMLIDNYIQEEKNRIAEEKALAAMEENENLSVPYDDPISAFSPAGIQGRNQSVYYFYSPQSVEEGRNMFLNQWGNRKNEDHWRRRNKSIGAGGGFENEETSDSTENANANLTPTDKDFYLVNIPFTEEKINASNNRIKNAMMQLGILYMDKLEEYQNAIRTFEELNTRFPNHDKKLEAYYYLYTCNLEIQNQPRAEYYKNLIINEYPNSLQAKILSNPEYIKELEAERLVVETIYNEAFQNYSAGQYDKALNICNQIETNYPENLLIHKVKLLKALSVGIITSPATDKITPILEEITQNYTGTEEAAIANMMLKTIQAGSENNIFIGEEEVLYKFMERKPHYYIILSNNPDFDLTEIRLQFSMYNRNFFDTWKLEAKLENIGGKEVIVIKTVDDDTQGRVYINEITNNEEMLAKYNPEDYSHFIISKDNYDTLIKHGSIDVYKRFYNNHYPQQQ